MRQLIKILSGLLVFQIVITVAANIGDNSLATFQGDEKLISINFDDINNIRISAGAEGVIDIKRENDEWVIPELDDFPVDQDKIADFISTLSSIKKGWPVATTSGAGKRFKVDADEFARNIVLQKDDNDLASIYIGTSPGFRKVHARIADNDEIHAVEFSVHDASVSADDWINKNILNVGAANIVSLELADIKLKRDGEVLTLEDLGEKEALDEAAVSDLLKRVSDVSIDKVLGIDKDKLKVKKLELSYTLTTKDDEKLSYEFSSSESGKNYILKTSKYKHYFEIQGWKVSLIKDFNREKLVKAKEAPVNAADKIDGNAGS